MNAELDKKLKAKNIKPTVKVEKKTVFYLNKKY